MDPKKSRLSDAHAVWLADTMARNAARFGGWSMELDPNATPPADTAPADPAPGSPSPAQDSTDWKAEARKWEERAKANKDAAARLAEIEEASKTEAQKRAEEVERLRKENEAFKAAQQIAAWKAEISQATEVPAEALAGATKEELEAHAEVLKGFITKQRPASSALNRVNGGNAPLTETTPGVGTLRAAYANPE